MPRRVMPRRPEAQPHQHATRHASSSTSDDTSTQQTRPEPVPALACERRSPRPCVNQALVDELAVMVRYRFLEYGPNHPKGMSYARAVSAIIGTPWVIKSGKEAQKYIPKIGDKLASRIDEFNNFGFIQEIRDLKADERFQTLQLLNQVHGVGPEAAKTLWSQGFRTLEQLAKAGKMPLVRYHADIQLKIPRSEVESVHDYVKIQLDKIQPGAFTVLMGGYRRGKTESNDIDILVTYPHQEGKERGVLGRLLHRLVRKGLIPEDGILNWSNAASSRTTVENRAAEGLDALDRAFVIFKHPANGTTRKRDYWRRVDLIVTRWCSYGAAVVGWSGSTTFERDLRLLAQQRGYKFDSGGLRTAHTSEAVPTQTEKDVFRALGIPYIEPEFRNADP